MSKRNKKKYKKEWDTIEKPITPHEYLHGKPLKTMYIWAHKTGLFIRFTRAEPQTMAPGKMKYLGHTEDITYPIKLNTGRVLHKERGKDPDQLTPDLARMNVVPPVPKRSSNGNKIM